MRDAEWQRLSGSPTTGMRFNNVHLHMCSTNNPNGYYPTLPCRLFLSSSVATTAEWLCLGQAAHILTVKGLNGGEKLRPSSFATSAAAFGRSREVSQLLGSTRCNWRTFAAF
jgi:hypothetical protein